MSLKDYEMPRGTDMEDSECVLCGSRVNGRARGAVRYLLSGRR